MKVEFPGSAGVLHVCPMFSCTGLLTTLQNFNVTSSEWKWFACMHLSSFSEGRLQQLVCKCVGLHMSALLPQACFQNRVCVGHCFNLEMGFALRHSNITPASS